MTDVPETHYTRSADGTALAYHVSGNGQYQLVFLSGGSIPIDLLREEPGFVRLSKRLGAFSRTVWFEPRGTGHRRATSETLGSERPPMLT